MAGSGGYYNPYLGVVFQQRGSLAPVGGPRATPAASTNPNAGQPVSGGSIQPPGSGGSGAGGAGPAVQAGVNLTPAGSPIDRPPALQNTIAAPLRNDEYIGIRTDAPERVLPDVASPYSINWDDTEKMGALGVRRGMLMLSDNKRTVDGGTTYANYFGSGVVAIPPTDYSEAANKAGFLLLSLGSNSTFGKLAATNAGWVVRTSPKWSRERDLENVSSLSIVVSSPSSGTLRVVAVDSGGVNINAVAALTIRYSTINYPVSIDGIDDTNSTAITEYDRGPWDGASTGNVDTADLTAGTYFVSAWSLSRLGAGVRAIGKVVVT